MIKFEDILSRSKLVRSRRAKSITLRIDKDGNLRITYPPFYSIKEVSDFLHQKKDWIISSVKKQKVLKRDYSYFKIGTVFNTILRKYRIVSTQDRSFVSARENEVILGLNKDINLHKEETQDWLKNILTEVIRDEAKYYLPNRTYMFANKHKLTVNKVFIKNLKSRWGSCSNLKNINLNLHLMMLNNELIDYVIHHELAHLKHRNHGKNFWDYLESIYPGAMLRDQELNHYNIGFEYYFGPHKNESL